MLRYDLIEGQWVVTDLRLGMPGYHPFRFALARVAEDKSSSLIAETELWPAPEADFGRLADLFNRAVDSDQAFSLAALAATLDDAPGRIANER